ncbi:MAG: hypothetical protein PF961_00465 [Planctomycetota bacterium]|nr:hypothetical protein [Planctomycetota bacterium]
MSTVIQGGVDPRDPAVRARNLKLGFIVGGGAVLVLILAFIRFVVFGLPEDRATRERLEQQRSAATGAAEPTDKDRVHE